MRDARRGSCVGDICGTIAPGGHEIGGPTTFASSPTFLFLPKEEAAPLRMSLVTQAHRWDRPDDIGFAELPIVRVSEFRDTTISIVGVRMQPGFRQGCAFTRSTARSIRPSTCACSISPPTSGSTRKCTG